MRTEIPRQVITVYFGHAKGLMIGPLFMLHKIIIEIEPLKKRDDVDISIPRFHKN
jgi:hypothetical protein